MTPDTPPTAADLAAWQALADEATPGPWEVYAKGNTVKSLSILGVAHNISPRTGDAAFIAASRAALPRLLSSYKQMDEQIDRLVKHIMANVPGEPSRNEGAIDCAIRLLSALAAEQARARALEALLAKAVLFVRYAKFDAGYQKDGQSYVMSRKDVLAEIDAVLAAESERR